MRITKCDICKKTVNSNDEITRVEVRSPEYNHFEICLDCSDPIMKILRDKKLLTGVEINQDGK